MENLEHEEVIYLEKRMWNSKKMMSWRMEKRFHENDIAADSDNICFKIENFIPFVSLRITKKEKG